MFVLLKNYNVHQDSIYLYIPEFNIDIERILIELYYRDSAEGLVETAFAALPFGETAVDFCDWIKMKRNKNNNMKILSLLDALENHLTTNLEKI